MSSAEVGREQSFGQDRQLSPVDRFGVWLSGYQIRRSVGNVAGKHVADLGCGYDATYARTILSAARSVTLLDVTLADDLRDHPWITAIEGTMPEALADIPTASLDVVMSISVVEHLWDPQASVDEFRRILRPGGVCVINVPSWLGKRALEFSAFKLGLSPAEEMDDHKTYYDPRDLWPLLVRAGFRPHAIKCFRHKALLNTFAVCRVDANDETQEEPPQ